MGLTKCTLGNLIEQSINVNSDMQYGPEAVRGMTITKQIIPTKADVSSTDLSKFLIVLPEEFVYNPRTHGKKIGFGYNDSSESFLISWNNIAFRVKPEKRSIVLPEYLFLHFNRSEWDREACYRSWGSSTEVFSWDALCEMEILLPPIDIQQKYVDIYVSLLANQQAYESGLDDLRLACEAFVDRLQREITLEPIGPYLIPSDVRNEMGLGANFVRGLAVSKQMIPTKADMDGVNLSNYKIVPPQHIAYVPDTSRRGDKMSLGMNITEETVLVSSISIVFTTNNEKLLPEYLMLFFSRSEFDRYARFHSWGSARETFDWDEMCAVEIPIPDIKVQQSIVDIYNSYTARREINEKLKEQIRDICPILIKGSLAEGT